MVRLIAYTFGAIVLVAVLAAVVGLALTVFLFTVLALSVGVAARALWRRWTGRPEPLAGAPEWPDLYGPAEPRPTVRVRLTAVRDVPRPNGRSLRRLRGDDW